MNDDRKLPTGVVRRRRPDTHPTEGRSTSPSVAPVGEASPQVSSPTPPQVPAPTNAVGPAAVVADQALLANFTHQIINPLNGVLGTLDNIIDGTVSQERRPQRLRALYSQLAVTIELVRNLAWLSQLSTSSGRDALTSTQSDVVLPKLIIEAAQFFQETAERRGMRVRLEDRDTQYIVRGHAPLLRQVFMNLIENGIKYGDEGSHLRIHARPQKRSGALLVEVIGVGEGFLPEERERMFELGFRGAFAKRVRASGSGLGLFICRQILALHDAELTAESSAAGRVVTFRMKFPRFDVGPARKGDEVDL